MACHIRAYGSRCDGMRWAPPSCWFHAPHRAAGCASSLFARRSAGVDPPAKQPAGERDNLAHRKTRSKCQEVTTWRRMRRRFHAAISPHVRPVATTMRLDALGSTCFQVRTAPRAIKQWSMRRRRRCVHHWSSAAPGGRERECSSRCWLWRTHPLLFVRETRRRCRIQPSIYSRRKGERRARATRRQRPGGNHVQQGFCGPRERQGRYAPHAPRVDCQDTSPRQRARAFALTRFMCAEEWLLPPNASQSAGNAALAVSVPER